MKNYRIVKGKHIHINELAANSRKNTVNNCTIPKSSLELYQVPWNTITNKLSRFNVGPNMAGRYYKKGKKGELTPLEYSWNIQKDGYKQPKTLRKKYKKKYWNRDGTIRKIVSHPSDFDKFPDRTFHPNLGQAWYMEQVTQHKIARWERKNPCPVKTDQNPPDIFEKEFLEPWKAQRELALERIRDFVVSMYDKLPLTGRFQKAEHVFIEEPVAEIKDYEGDGHKINEADPKKSKTIKKAQKVTNAVHAKHKNLVCTNLKDHKRTKGRILIPKAA